MPEPDALVTVLNKTEEETDISSTAVIKRLSGLAIPMALSYTFSIEMSLLVFFLSRLSADKPHEASITLTTSMLNSLNIIGLSPLLAMSMVAGKKYGELCAAQRDGETDLEPLKEAIARVNPHGLLIATAMTPVVVLPLTFSEALLKKVFRQEEEVARISQSFLRPYAAAVPAILFRLCAEQMMFAFGRTKPAMIIGLLTALIGMGLATTLAFGKLGAPKLGETGLLIGYLSESYLTAIAFSLYMAFHPEFRPFSFFKPKRFFKDLRKIQELLALGGPMLLGNTIEMGCLLATSAVSGLCGVSEQAAFSTTMQFTLFTFLLQAAFGQSTTQEMSRLIGERAYRKASKIGLYSIPSTLAFVATIPILFSIKPDWLMRLLGQEHEESYNMVKVLIWIMTIAVILDALRYNLLQQLRNNLGDGRCATLVSSGSLLVGVLLSWLLATQTNMGIFGVALGYGLGGLAASLVMLLRWKSRITPLAIETQAQTAALINTSSRHLFFQPPPQPGLETDLLLEASDSQRLRVVVPSVEPRPQPTH